MILPGPGWLDFFADVVLASLGTTRVGAETLTQSQIKSLFPGSYSVLMFGRYDFCVNLRPNGTISGVAGKYRDMGKWTVEGSTLYVAWDNWTTAKRIAPG